MDNDFKPIDESKSEKEETTTDTVGTGLFAENLTLDDFVQKEEEKKSKGPGFFVKHKKLFIIVGSIISFVLIIFLAIYGVRISAASRACKQIIGQDFYSRAYISRELSDKGFNDIEIDRAIKRNKVNFDVNVNKSLYKLIATPTKFLSKDSLIKELQKQEYTDEEIDRLFLTINWEDFLDTYLSNYMNNTTEEINKRNVIEELRTAGFNQTDINIISSSFRWDDLGKAYVKKYFEENTYAGKNDVKTYLEGKGFSTNEVESIFLMTDWNKQALACINNYINNPKDETGSGLPQTEVQITKELFENVLGKMGFTESEITYAITNFDFSTAIDGIIKNLIQQDNKIIKKNSIKEELKKKQFSDEEIESAFATMKWSEYALSTCTQYLATNKANKNDALKFLSDNGYTTEEVNYADAKTSWGTYAIKALGYMLEGNKKTKDELFATLKEYGYSEEDIMTAKSSTSFASYAYNYVINTQSESTLSIISQNEVKNLLTKAGYENESSTVLGKIDFDKNATTYLKSLLDAYLKEPKVYDIDEIYNTMQNKGFTNALVDIIQKYDWSTFATNWSQKYLEKNNSEPNKGYYNECFKKMKISKKDDSSLEQKLKVQVDWQSYANKIAETRRDMSDNKSTVESYLLNLGYSDELEIAINKAFPPS